MAIAAAGALIALPSCGLRQLPSSRAVRAAASVRECRRLRRIVCWASTKGEEEAGLEMSGGRDEDEDEEDEDDDGAPSWVSNVPVYLLWAGFVGYAAFGAPNQTPYRDMLFLETLLLLRGDVSINPLLVTVFFSMGVLPLTYSMLLIPTGRSSKGPPVWPFSLVSYFVGAFALLPYFGLWDPPPPSVSKNDLTRWPLAVLESKWTAGFAALCAAGLVTRAAFCDGETWMQYFRFFKESKFIHVMSIDFVLLSLLAVFWVYNDVSIRTRHRGSWLPALAIFPVLGPALYLLLRPRLPAEMIKSEEQ